MLRARRPLLHVAHRGRRLLQWRPDPSKWAVPVLQSKLRSKLGPKAKLPKKKDELLRLYEEHFD